MKDENLNTIVTSAQTDLIIYLSTTVDISWYVKYNSNLEMV